MTTLKTLEDRLASAIGTFWSKRDSQLADGGSDGSQAYAGSRGAVVGGGHLDGFITLVHELLVEGGLQHSCVFVSKSKKKPILPGFFRATKNWDLVVVDSGKLIAIIEFKSHVGSLGNNFNNRVEEALGNATDLHTAYREGAFAPSQAPWLGYVMLLEDSADCHSPVKTQEPHFKVLPEWKNASYAQRYEVFCKKLVRERLYSAACFLISARPEKGKLATYTEPSQEIGFKNFAASLIGHAAGIATLKENP
jgi:hypothetical protein